MLVLADRGKNIVFLNRRELSAPGGFRLQISCRTRGTRVTATPKPASADFLIGLPS